MKKLILFLLAVLLCPMLLFAQPILFGLVSSPSNPGSILRYDVATNTLTSVYQFQNQSTDGFLPTGSMVQASNGLFYGTTTEGGSLGNGVLFSFDPVTNTYLKRADFNGLNGAKPYGSLIQAANGLLYGMTSEGGADGKGLIFSFDPNTNSLVKQMDFTGANGANPYGSLLQASDGNLYGMTKAGGVLDVGVLFSWNPATAVYTKLHDFIGAPSYLELPVRSRDGAQPFGSLLQASDQKLYGMTNTGGDYALGTIFSYDIANATYRLEYDNNVNWGNGYFSYPYGNFVEGRTGYLYGMNKGMGSTTTRGNIFYTQTGKVATTMTNVKAFTEYLSDFFNGRSPSGSLMKASNGLLYGTATNTLFSIDPETNTFTRLQTLAPEIFNSNYGHFIEWTCSAPKVTIADARALKEGVDANTVYLGYTPAASITLHAGVEGSSGAYTYLWSNGATTPSIVVSPATKTTYTVTVKDNSGCTGTAAKEINIVDVRCGNKLDKVMICKEFPGNLVKDQAICVSANAVPALLAHGAYLGGCSNKISPAPPAITIEAAPNPSATYFTLRVGSDKPGEWMLLLVANSMGRVVEIRKVISGQTVQLGAQYKPGIYYVELIRAWEKASLRLVKTP